MLRNVALASFAILLGTWFLAPSKAVGEEQTLRMLVWEGYAPEVMTKQFASLVEEKYDVKLNIEVAFCETNDDFFPALRNGAADLISPSHPVLKDERWQLMKLQLTLPLNLENIPNYQNVIPALQSADYCTVDGHVYAVPHIRGPYGLAYNTALVKEAPTSWSVLWDPQYKGKYTVGNQYEQNVYVTALTLGIAPEKMHDYRTVNTPEMQDKLAQMAGNAKSLWEGVDKVEDLQGLSLATVWGFSLPALEEAGETWKIAEPAEGTTGWVDNFMISQRLESNPKLRRIAEEWLNFVLSDVYQVYVVRGLACPPTTTSVAAKLTPEEVERFHLDEPTHFETTRLLWPTLGKRDRSGLKRLWENAVDQGK